jgi:hypothetical protein
MTRASGAPIRFYTAGHTNLALTLDSSQDAIFTGDVNATDFCVTGGTCLSGVGSGSVGGSGTTNYLSKWTAGATLGNSVIYDDGTSVGIGTTSPDNKLHISGSGDLLKLETSLAGVGDVANVLFDHQGTPLAKLGSIIEGAGDAGLAFYTTTDAGSNIYERLRIDNSGNVGIGTAEPSDKLHVSSIDGEGITIQASVVPVMTIKRNNSATATGNINWVGSDDVVDWQIGVNDAVAGSFDIQQGTTSRIFIESTGDVGIGTTSPDSSLHIFDNNPRITLEGESFSRLNYIEALDDDNVIIAFDENNEGAGSYFAIRGDGAERMRIDAAGDVTIGTGSGGTAHGNANNFVIDGTGVVGMTILTPTTLASTMYFGDSTSPTLGRIEYAMSSHATTPNSMLLWTDNTLALTIDSSQDATFTGLIWSSRTDPNIISYGTTAGSIATLQATARSSSTSGEAITRWVASSTEASGVGSQLELQTRQTTGAGAAVLTALTIDSSQDAIFAGNVNATDVCVAGGTCLSSIGSGSVGGSGSPNYMPKWITGANLGNSLIYDDGTNIGIGTDSPTHKLNLQGTGDSTTGVLGIDVTGFGSFKWASSAMAPSLVSGNNIIHMIGQAESLKNSGYIGFNYDSTGSDNNFLTFGLYSVDNVLNINGAGNVGIGTTTPDTPLEIYKSSAGSSTLLTLSNQFGDLTQQQSFIDFNMIDSNDNFKPQVRIGAEVGENGNADTQLKEGSGAFVVYTATGTGATTGTLSEKFRVSYNGNVGIGTTTPGAKLTVVGDASFSTGITTPIIYGTYNTLEIKGPSTASGFALKDSGGVVDGYVYAVNGDIGFLDDDAAWAIRVDTDVGIEFKINNIVEGSFTTAGLTVTNGFTVSAGTVNFPANSIPGDDIVDGSIDTSELAANSVGNSELIASPTFTTVNAASFLYTSDGRLKQNIKNLDGQKSLDAIKKLNPVEFNWIESGNAGIGFIAQDVEKVFPEFVGIDGESGMLAVKYGNIVAPLVAAVQEQQFQIEEQNILIKELSERLEELENRLLGGEK